MLGSKLGATLVYSSDPKISGLISGLAAGSLYFSESALSLLFGSRALTAPVLLVPAPLLMPPFFTRSLSFANSAALIPFEIAIGSACSIDIPLADNCAFNFATSASEI